MTNAITDGPTTTFTKKETFGGLTTNIIRGKDFDSVVSIACGRDFIPVTLPKCVSTALAPHAESVSNFNSFVRFTGTSIYEQKEQGDPVLLSFTAQAFDIYDNTVEGKATEWKAGFVGRGGGHWQGDTCDSDSTNIHHS